MVAGGFLGKEVIRELVSWHTASPWYSVISPICIILGVLYLFVNPLNINQNIRHSFQVMSIGIILSILIMSLSFTNNYAIFIFGPVALIAFGFLLIISLILVIIGLRKVN